MKALLTSLLAFFTISIAAQPLEYRFDEIKRKVLLQGAQAAKGQQAHGGDKVTTGWFSYARIASERHRATFEIFSSTDVTLASDTPGVILSLERGRIRAAFDKITGSEPRVVKTPGALLAVRGTEFDVTVDASGNTTLDVWEGIVEVTSPLQEEPQFVRAGEMSRFGPQRPPQTGPMPDHRRRDREPGMDPGRDGRDGRDRMPPPDGHSPDPNSGDPNALPSDRKPRPPRPPESK